MSSPLIELKLTSRSFLTLPYHARDSYREPRARCNGRTVRDRTGNGRQKSFGLTRGNFPSEGCRLKYARFARYGRFPVTGGYNGRSTAGTPNGSSGRTEHFLSGHYSQLLFGRWPRYFSSVYVSIEYARFSRYGRKSCGDTSRLRPVGFNGNSYHGQTAGHRPPSLPAVLLTRAGSTTLLRDEPNRGWSV